MGDEKSPARYLLGAEVVEGEEGLGAGRDGRWLYSGATEAGEEGTAKMEFRGLGEAAGSVVGVGGISPARGQGWGCFHRSPGGSSSAALRGWVAQLSICL